MPLEPLDVQEENMLFIAHCNTIVGAAGHIGSLYLPNALIKALEGKTSIPPATGRVSVAPCPAGVTWRG